jgi:DNA-binding CsgD family transcriptional regulator
VGRDGELAAVAAFLDAVPSGPGCLLLAGEAGIGKTTVWGAGAAWAAERSYAVLSCRPAESEATLSYAALGDLLEEVLDRVLPLLPAPQRRALEVALLLADPAGRPPQQRAVSVAFLTVIRHLCVSAPLVLAIDDLQWLDAPSAATVDFALRRLSHEPVGLLASIRDRIGEHAALMAAVPTERLTRLHIGPLAFGAFQSVVRATVGSGLSRLTIRRLFDASGGNPFYGLELAWALHRAGAEPSPGEPLPVPADLQGVLRARLAALPDDAQDALLVAACLQSPTISMLEQARGHSALVSLQAAAVQGVVEFGGDRVRFSHPLFASAIYSSATPGRRRAAHWSLGEIAPTAEERARHLALSCEGPDEYVATALDQAARTAATRGAPGVAAELAELAVRLTPDAALDALWRRRARVGRYLFRAGDTALARRDLQALVEEMPAGRDRAHALLVLATVLFFTEGEPAGIEMLEQALGEASADPVLQARIHLEIAGRTQVDLAKSAMHAEAGLALSRQLGNPGLVGAALVLKVTQDFLLGRGLDTELIERGVELERQAMPARVRDRAIFAHAVCLTQADRFDEARGLFEETLQAALDEGDESSLANVLAHLADLECWTGNWATAEHYALESWQAAEQVGHRAWRTVQLYVQSLLDAHLGRTDAARAAAIEGLSVATAAQDSWTAMMLYGVLGFAELTVGNFATAETSLSRAVGLADVIGLAEPAASRIHANHIEALIGLGDLPRAERLLGWLEERGHATGRAWTLATSARCRGLLFAARGDTEAAVEALEDALRHHQQLDMPFELGRTLLVMGQVQRRAKRKRIAKEHLEHAEEIFESLPSPPWAERARAELARIGLRPPAPLALTATEERVAAMAASGHTNRQVAQAMFLSPRTVEANLARIYRKLGISSRAELGAAMARSQAGLQS